MGKYSSLLDELSTPETQPKGKYSDLLDNLSQVNKPSHQEQVTEFNRNKQRPEELPAWMSQQERQDYLNRQATEKETNPALNSLNVARQELTPGIPLAGKEAVAVLGSELNTMGFGAPKFITNKIGGQGTYPEAQTGAGKVLQEISGAMGYGGAPLKIAQTMGKIVKGTGVIKQALKGAIEGATFGLTEIPKSSQESGQDFLNPEERIKSAKTFGVIGGAIPLVSGAIGKGLEKVGGLVKKRGEGAYEKLAMLTDSEKRAGMNIELINKHKLGTDIETIANNTQKKLDETMASKMDIINQMPALNIMRPFADAAKLLTQSGKTALRLLGTPDAAKKASAMLNKLFENAFTFTKGKQVVNAETFLKMARSFGKKGDWTSDIDKTIADTVYDTLYTAFRRNMQKAANTPELKSLNKDIHELMLVDRMAGRRLSQVKRQNPLSLTDYIIGSAGLAGLAATQGDVNSWSVKYPFGALLLNRLIRSPKLYGMGKAMENLGRAFSKTSKGMYNAEQQAGTNFKLGKGQTQFNPELGISPNANEIPETLALPKGGQVVPAKQRFTISEPVELVDPNLPVSRQPSDVSFPNRQGTNFTNRESDIIDVQPEGNAISGRQPLRIEVTKKGKEGKGFITIEKGVPKNKTFGKQNSLLPESINPKKAEQGLSYFNSLSENAKTKWIDKMLKGLDAPITKENRFRIIQELQDEASKNIKGAY